MRAVSVSKQRPRVSDRKLQPNTIELAISRKLVIIAGIQPSEATVDVLRSRLQLTVEFIWRWYDLDRTLEANASKKSDLAAAIAARDRALVRLKKEAAGYLSATEEIERVAKDLVSTTEASWRASCTAYQALLRPFVEGKLVGAGPSWLWCFSSGHGPSAHDATQVREWAYARCGGPPQRERRNRLVVDAIPRLKPLELFQSAPSSKRGRSSGLRQNGAFHALVFCLLSAVKEARGSLTFSEAYGNGSLAVC